MKFEYLSFKLCYRTTFFLVRFSRFSNEYYDDRVLTFISNRIGKTVKVNKNKLFREIGKYARLGIQVYMTKPLLAMFSIKGRHYKVDYEGLNILCLTCGRFRHYFEGCVNKCEVTITRIGEIEENGGMSGGHKENIIVEKLRPWTIVQNTRRPQKNMVGSKSKNDKSTMKGSETSVMRK